MREDREINSRGLRHGLVLAGGALLGAALFVYFALVKDFIRGRPYGAKWWTSLILGTVVSGCVAGLAALFVYMRLRRERATDNHL